MEEQSKVFLSYSRENKDFAVRLAKQLKAEGFQIWLDRLDASLNARWDDQVEQALDESKIYMVILTPSSITADNVQDELGFALDTKKQILSVLPEPMVLPVEFNGTKYVDFSNKSFDEAVNSTKDLLRSLMGLPPIEEKPAQPDLIKQEPERLVVQQAEADRAVKVQEEQAAKIEAGEEQKAREEADRIATQRVAEEFLASQKAEQERAPRAAEEEQEKAKEGIEHIIAQKVEERLTRQLMEEERKLREETERIIAQKVEERLTRQLMEEERRFKEETERLIAQKVEERLAQQKAAEEERLAIIDREDAVRRQATSVTAFHEEKTDSKWFKRSPAARGLVFGIASVVVLALAGIGFGVYSNRTAVVDTQTPTVVQPTDLPPTAAATNTEEILIPVSSGPAMEVGSSYNYIDGSTLVAVPAGSFSMGGNTTDNPAHEVKLSDYWIYSTEVTNQQYALCVKMGKCTPPALETNPGFADYRRANDPVTGVTYDQASTYCSFVNGRLPTEAEWEKAAQNLQGGKYPWGEMDPSCDLLNFNNCTTTGIAHVVSYPKGTSSYGAFDMAGNAFEWVSDWYDAAYYTNSPAENPTGPEAGTARSVRSSSFASTADQIAVSTRSSENPATPRTDLSFRCVVQKPDHFAPFCELPAVYTHTQQTNVSVCPEVGIKESPFCIGAVPSTNVIFSGPADATVDSKNCQPSDKPNLFTCQTPDTVVSISAKCEVLPPVGDPSCPSGYVQQNGVCVADAGSQSGTCLSGTFDPATQCCKMPQNTSAIPICSVGTYYSVQQTACLPYPVQETVVKSVKVSYAATCSVPATGGNGTTPAPPE